MLTSVSLRMEDAARVKQWLYARFMAVAERVGSNILDGKPVPLSDRLMYRLGDFIIYGPLKNAMGLSRIRVAYTAGADRKSVVEGKSVSGRVDLGGRRIIKKKKKTRTIKNKQK